MQVGDVGHLRAVPRRQEERDGEGDEGHGGQGPGTGGGEARAEHGAARADGDGRRGEGGRGRRAAGEGQRDALLAPQQVRGVGDARGDRLGGALPAAAQGAVGEAGQQRLLAVGELVVARLWRLAHRGSRAAATCSRARNRRLMMVPSRVRSRRAASRYERPTTSTAMMVSRSGSVRSAIAS